ncbi:hypothetical protein GWR57_07295 [Bacillus subtilis subsp. subtilis]|uniref:hypothetical protein n=1 Tax=Bacillus subtilis TaxID=1423 RepID=UPI001378B215|nr:hypothetical protein [Bacillus subtilis]NCT23850.1 hypothetical protein [Bacillus subtilis subsp. subtilis]
MIKVSEKVDLSTLKVVPGHTKYFCDIEAGKVYSTVSNRWLNPKPNDIGYVMTALKTDAGKNNPYYMHEIVMMAACEVTKDFWREKNLEIDHIDMDKSNNSFANLKFTTRALQYDKRVKEKMSQRKLLTENEVKEIREAFTYWEDAKLAFCKQMASVYGCAFQTVQSIINNKTHKVEAE